MFGCKFRAALQTTSRRPQRNAVIPATDGNAELVMKKSPCILYVLLQSFHSNTELIMNSSCMSFSQSFHAIHFELRSIPVALLPSIKKLYHNQRFGGLALSRIPHAVYKYFATSLSEVGSRAPFWIFPWKQALPAFRVPLECCWLLGK